MAKEIKTIGILTSGGDAPGMNAAIRAVVRSAIFRGLMVIGIRRGYSGLLNNDMSEMNLRSVSEIIHRGGTILYTARCKEMMTREGVERAVQNLREHGIDALVVIGGDGTFRGAREIARMGFPVIGIPATIDNDVACSDYTIGFDTAMNTATEMIDKLRDTATSHERCSVVQVMGRDAGFLAVNTGIACGALSILIPETAYDLDRDVCDKMLLTQRTGKRHFIIVVAEGAGNALEIAKQIEEKTGIDSRATVLGYVQRGGTPSTQDRIVASSMGYRAVECLANGSFNRIVAQKGGRITDIDIEEALNATKTIDRNYFSMSSAISL